MFKRHISPAALAEGIIYTLIFIVQRPISVNPCSVSNDLKADGLFFYFPDSLSPLTKTEHGLLLMAETEVPVIC